jgi:HAD superfamily hydrolase (TIGR01509 family)
MIQAIIFDFDGTILDTERHEYESWQEIYQQHEVHLPLELWLHQVGTVSVDFHPYRHLEQTTRRSLDQEVISARRRQRFLELVAQEALRPGVQDLIEAAHGAGLRLGVASSATRDWVEGHLAQRDLRRYFSVVRTSADVQRVKPDPELYLSALAALEVEPQHALAIEDSRHGLLAAKRAGMKCVVAPNPITQGLDFSEADLVLPSLAGITLADLLKRISEWG